MNTIPKHILWIINILNEHDFEAFLVGGCVRDMLMERTINDYDITTNALPEQVMELFHAQHCSVIPTGIQHGTVTVLVQAFAVEITTYRIEQAYQNHRSPSSILFTSHLYEDLKRRDFTMNAIAYHPRLGLLDPYDGQIDIQNHLIRCVGEATLRLQEDALRILRALRFQATLHFQIEESAKQAILQNAHLLTFISKERIREEFNKLLMGDQMNTLQCLRETGVLPYILPGYEILYDYPQKTPWHIYDIFRHTDVALNHTLGNSLCTKLAIIFHDIGKVEVESFDEQGIAHYKKHAVVSAEKANLYLQALKYERKTIERVNRLILFHDYYLREDRRMLRRYLAKFDNNLTDAFEALDVQLADDHAKNMEKAQEKIDIILRCKTLMRTMEQEQDMVSLKTLAINGRDLMDYHIQGKAIGEGLQYALQCVMEDPSCNTLDQLLPFVLHHIEQE